jgi:hypothetical protein
MLRSMSRAMLVSAIVAAPAGAQFGAPPLGFPKFEVLATDWQPQNGVAVSNGLTLIDEGIRPDVVVASPEPASVALVATGLIGVAGIVRRKKNERIS